MSKPTTLDMRNAYEDHPNYPGWREYNGGGSLLNPHTPALTVISECDSLKLLVEVTDLLKAGYEVIILHRTIQAARRYPYRYGAKT